MCSEKRILVGCSAERLFWTFVWTIAGNLFKQFLGKEEQCALCGSFTELLRRFVFVNKAIYSWLQNNILINYTERGKQPELIIVQYRINGQREEDFNTLMGRNNCERNFCGIYFCDFTTLITKMFCKMKKRLLITKKRYDFERKHTKMWYNWQNLFYKTYILEHLIAKTRSTKIYFAVNFFFKVTHVVFLYTVYIFLYKIYI